MTTDLKYTSETSPAETVVAPSRHNGVLGKSALRIFQIGNELYRERHGNPEFSARELTNEEEILEARKFATQRFMDLKKINPEKVYQDGPYKGLLKEDSLLDTSTFFGVYDEADSLVATARFVWDPTMNVRDTRMPFDALSEENRAKLDAIPTGKSAEFASLAKVPGASNAAVLKLIREMVHWSYRNNVQYFTSGLEPKAYPLYSSYFGGAVTRLHTDTVEFPGITGQQIPMMVDLGSSLEDGFDKQRQGISGLRGRVMGMIARASLRYPQ